MQKQAQVVSSKIPTLLILMTLSALVGCSGGGDSGGKDSNPSGGESNVQGGVHGPLNGRIVYEAFGRGYILDLATGHKTRLPAELDDDPKGSSDGTEIVSIQEANYTTRDHDLIVISKADGRRISSFPVSAGANLPKLSPDGQTILVYTSDGVTLFSRDGKLQKSRGLGDCNWAPDGQLVCTSEGVIYHSNADLTQGQEIRGGFETRPDHLSVSPDGSQIVFGLLQPNAFGSEKDIWIMNMDGTGLRQLTDSSDGHGEFHTTWSPDGRWVLVRQRLHGDGGWDEYTTNSDGKLFAVPANANKVDLTLINPDRDHPSLPFDPPDSPAMIINEYGESSDYLAAVTAGKSSLTWLDPIPSNPGSLPNSTDEPNRGLSGTAYYSTKPIGGDSYEVWALDLASGVSSQLPANIHKSSVPSPDGSEFATVVGGSNENSITLVDRDGGSETSIFTAPYSLSGPVRFSQDSSQLAFLADKTAAPDEKLKKPGVMVITQDGADIAFFPGFTSYDWLPDGDLALAGSNDEVHRGNVQSSTSTQLFSMGGMEDSIYHLAASPNGKRVAFGMAGRVWVSDLDGKNQQRLTQSPQSEAQPQWSPDGRYILVLYFKDYSGVANLWVVAADAQNVQVGNEKLDLDTTPLKAINENGDLKGVGSRVPKKNFGTFFSWR